MKKILFIFLTAMLSCTNEVPLPKDELKPNKGEIDRGKKIIDDRTNNDKPNSNSKDDSNIELGHDVWSKVTFTFTEGKLINGSLKCFENQSTSKFKTVQKVSFELDGMAVKRKGDTVRLVNGNNYGLEVKYYSTSGKLINNQFATKKMAPIHQHFFISSERGNNTLRQTKKYTIDYTYRDTSPIDKSIVDSKTRLRINDPIGLKGYFKVIKSAPYSFDMNAVLVHVLGRNKFNKDGSARPFYSPTRQMIGVTDFHQKIPMKIFTDKKSDNFIKDVATEFNITQEKVKQELKQRKIGSLQL